MTFTELTYFIETYQKKSISKAAESFYVESSVISKAIKRLESEFSVLLFYRSANRLTPTNAGNEFYSFARDILFTTSSLKQNMQRYSTNSPESKIIKIAVDSGMSSQKDNLLNLLSHYFPDVSFQIADTINHFFLTNNDFDISIETGFTSIALERCKSLSENYSIKIFSEQQAGIWISKNSPLNSYKIIPLDALKDYKNVTNNVLDSLGIPIQQHSSFVGSHENLLKYIENSGCYTFDMKDAYGKFHYDYLARNPNTTFKLTNTFYCFYAIYNTITAENFIPIISDTYTRNDANN